MPEVRALQRKGVGLEALQALQQFVGHGAAVQPDSLHQRRLGGLQVDALTVAAPASRAAGTGAARCSNACWRRPWATAAHRLERRRRPGSRASTSTTCRPKRLCTRRGSTPTSGLPKSSRANSGAHSVGRQPAQLAALRAAGAVRQLGRGRRRAKRSAAVDRAAHVRAGASARWRSAFTSTPGVTANRMWRSSTRSPTR
jgi:hypothetical protein